MATSPDAGWRYAQFEGGQEPWVLKAHNAPDLKEAKFATVLRLAEPYVDSQSKEPEYSGPLYFDFDDEEHVDYAVEDAKGVLAKLLEYGVPSHEIGIYLTGGRGVHLLIPIACLYKGSRRWHKGLPDIYREIAYRFAAPSLDTNVYSSKRGRMWRTCNKQRDNGAWKVQVSYAEFSAVKTEEDYRKLCTTQRIDSFNEAGGTLALDLSAVFAEAAAEVGERTARRSKAKKLTKKDLTEAWPTLKPLFEGKSQGGFNQIAIQLAVYARESGWDWKRFHEACAGLIANHQSDSARYRTARARLRELKSQFDYQNSPAGYTFSLRACENLLAPVKSEDVGSDEDLDEVYPKGEYDAGGSEPEKSKQLGHVWLKDDCYWSLRGEGGDTQLSAWMFTEAQPLVDKTAFKGAATTVSVYRCKINMADGEFIMYAHSFTSSSGVQNCLAGLGVSFSGNDIEARNLLPIVKSLGLGKMTYQTSLEGLFPYTLPNERYSRLIYSSGRGFITPEGSSGYAFAYQNTANPDGVLRSDLLNAPSILSAEGSLQTPEAEEWLSHLLNCRPPETLARLLGWHIAALYRPAFIELYDKFPMLHIYAQAGSGKTETVRLLSRLHYYERDAVETTPASTVYGMESLFSATWTIPIIFDEYKKADMPKEKLGLVRSLLRDSYNAREVTRGGGSQTAGRKALPSYGELAVTQLTAPIVLIAVEPENSVELLERSTMCLIKKPPAFLLQRQLAHAVKAANGAKYLSVIGKTITLNLVGKTSPELLATFPKMLSEATRDHTLTPEYLGISREVHTSQVGDPEYARRAIMQPRTLYNEAVAHFGWVMFDEFLKANLSKTAYKRFEAQLAGIGETFYSNSGIDRNLMLPEYVKVLSQMGLVSRGMAQKPIERGIDYAVGTLEGKPMLRIDPVRVYTAYRAAVRPLGYDVYFSSSESFTRSLLDSPVFLSESVGLPKDRRARVVNLAYDELLAMGMQAWAE